VKIGKEKFSIITNVAISAYGTARSTVEGTPLSSEELRKIDAYWRASLYLCYCLILVERLERLFLTRSTIEARVSNLSRRYVRILHLPLPRIALTNGNR